MQAKKMIYLGKDQERLLKRLAAEEKVSETEVMRRALSLYAREHLDDPLAALIGSIKGGPADGSRNHDRYLVEGPRAR
jgi:hypothetical protein